VNDTGVKSVTGLKGDSVTLYTDVPDIQRYAVIRWWFGQQNSTIAEINRTPSDEKTGRNFNTYYGPDERFRDRLQLDNQTGSMTIRNIETSHSGIYEAEIISSSRKHTIHKSFTVTVGE
ncbi:hypothetical protein M9458_045146, partial [Cirrhinus mrigala]